MKAINVLLSLAVSAILALLVLEGGLRLMGMGPVKSIHQFDEVTGWSKRPGAVGKRKTSEFNVQYEVNELGLRDDPMSSPKKPEGVFRVMMLGDSFVLGYTVERHDLFVDQLEGLWQDENRRVDVINSGTEAWSTDQEVAWFLENGADYEPDLVLIFPYENDLYWGGQEEYSGSPKPRFQPFQDGGGLEARTLVEPPAKHWMESFAVGKLARAFTKEKEEAPKWSPDGTFELVGPRLEWAAYFHKEPDFMIDAVARTRSALAALSERCSTLGSRLVMIPIPNKAAVDDDALGTMRKFITVSPDAWTPDKPVDTFLGLARDLEIEHLDPRATLEAHVESGKRLYFPVDWHLNPAGNLAFAEYLDHELDARGVFPEAHSATKEGKIETVAAATGFPTWGKVFLTLWVLLGTLFAVTYRKEENPALGFLKVGGMLAAIFAIVLGGNRLIAMVPPQFGNMLLLLFVVGILGFIVYKLGRRVSTILELLQAFVLRGHWYLLPLVVVLLTVGSLLVVAASSPLVAPFIYTLF